MPLLTVVQTIPANSTVNVLANWQFRQPNFPATLECLACATAVGLTQALTTGSEQIVQPQSPVGVFGGAGVLPNRLNVEPIVDGVIPGEELTHQVSNGTGAGVEYRGVYVLTPK